MTETALATQPMAVPSSGDYLGWTDQEAALMQFAKAGTRIVTASGQIIWQGAPREIVEAFIHYCNVSGLDPIAKQVYLGQIAGVWTIIGAIDGMRLVAERTGRFEGYTPKEWTYDDGETWRTIPSPPASMDKTTRPTAARVGVWRKGFREPLMVTISWAEFGKTTDKEKENWNVRPAWMLGIRAEGHALRAAFPAELSGVRPIEDFDDAETYTEVETGVDWSARIKELDDKEDMRILYREINHTSPSPWSPKLHAEFDAHLLTVKKDRNPKPGTPGNTGEPAVDEPVDAEIVEDEPTQDALFDESEIDPADPRVTGIE